jgi:hypothetical protein
MSGAFERRAANVQNPGPGSGGRSPVAARTSFALCGVAVGCGITLLFVSRNYVGRGLISVLVELAGDACLVGGVYLLVLPRPPRMSILPATYYLSWACSGVVCGALVDSHFLETGDADGFNVPGFVDALISPLVAGAIVSVIGARVLRQHESLARRSGTLGFAAIYWGTFWAIFRLCWMVAVNAVRASPELWLDRLDALWVIVHVARAGCLGALVGVTTEACRRSHAGLAGAVQSPADSAWRAGIRHLLRIMTIGVCGMWIASLFIWYPAFFTHDSQPWSWLLRSLFASTVRGARCGAIVGAITYLLGKDVRGWYSGLLSGVLVMAICVSNSGVLDSLSRLDEYWQELAEYLATQFVGGALGGVLVGSLSRRSTGDEVTPQSNASSRGIRTPDGGTGP